VAVQFFAFTCYGKAEPQGSASAYYVASLGRAVVTSANKANKGWRRDVAYSALEALKGTGLAPPAWPTGPVLLRVQFYLPRPKYIKDTLPPHLAPPDLDKLVRSVGDALKGIAWGDDKQVTEIEASKHYAPPGVRPHAHVRVISVPVLTL
jgi:Holliday junction resolvase RusA-like endonuclease